MSKKTKQPKSYYDKVHGWGRISTLSALCVLLMFPIAICLYLNVFPPISGILQGLLKLIPTYWTVAVVSSILLEIFAKKRNLTWLEPFVMPIGMIIAMIAAIVFFNVLPEEIALLEWRG